MANNFNSIFHFADTRDINLGQGAEGRKHTESEHVHRTFQQYVLLGTVADIEMSGSKGTGKIYAEIFENNEMFA